MTVKLLVLCVCCAVGTGTGYAVMRSFKRNYEYYKSLCALLAELKRNIAFRRDSAASVLGAFETKSALLKKNVSEYLTYVSDKNSQLVISRGFLPADVHSDVSKMFERLGSADGSTQNNDLDMYAAKFEVFATQASQKLDKYGAMAVKLGFLFGLGVGILFL